MHVAVVLHHDAEHGVVGMERDTGLLVHFVKRAVAPSTFPDAEPGVDEPVCANDDDAATGKGFHA